MEFNEYQRQAVSTAIYNQKFNIVYPALGLGNEAGELQGKIKKLMRDGDLEDISIAQWDNLVDEAGDVLWYLAVLCIDLGIDLDVVARRTVEKLQDRQSRGALGGSGDMR
jgi:NTP pyrophosphatase (non-canonical NTP hydrolase)